MQPVTKEYFDVIHPDLKINILPNNDVFMIFKLVQYC